MSDRSRSPTAVTATRIGRTDLGPCTVTLEDDSLILLVAGGEPPTHVPLHVVDEIVLSGGDLLLNLNDGTRLLLATESAARLHDDIAARCLVLPELTRTLRAFGSRRGLRSPRDSAPSDQMRFFAPLIAARKAAIAEHVADHAPERALAAFDAFDARLLRNAITDAIRALVRARYPEPGPEQRALEAELTDLTEPLLNALVVLGRAADAARARTDDLRRWRAWAIQLRATFETADRVWMLLDASLDAVRGEP